MKLTKRPRIQSILCIAIIPVAIGIPLFAIDSRSVPKSSPTRVATRTIGARPSDTPPTHFAGKVHFDILAKLLADKRRSEPPNDWLRALAEATTTARVATQEHPLLNNRAPDFTLVDHRGRSWVLGEGLRRGPVVVVFYLSYSCNACVHHLFELNADIERFRTLGAEVVAISGDAPQFTNLQFEKFGPFQYPALSDPEHRVAETFATFRAGSPTDPEKLQHGTFLIVRDGQVVWVDCGDVPFRDNNALLYEIARLEDKLPGPEATAADDKPRVTRP